jgi:hypothetical protein
MLSFRLSDSPLCSYALSREKNKCQLIYATAHGMALSSEVAILNHTTPEHTTLPLSANGRPLLWFDSNWDRNNEPDMTAPRGMFCAVLSAIPPVVVKTGRTQPMRARDGEEREAVEVELLLHEDQLSRQCWSCGRCETETDGQSWRMPR